MSRILCIEDDFFIADMYAKALRKANYDVDIIDNGDDAIGKAKETTYDVILLDIMLPNKNGIEILESLRNENGTGLSDTKIIVTTNFDEPVEIRKHLESLADGYLIKADIIPSKLVDLVGEVLSQQNQELVS